jgi:hypothetical protein
MVWEGFMSTDEQLPDDYFDDDGEYEPDEFEDELGNCCGFFESQSPDAVFVCGAVGSEDCDECPCYAWLGLTNKQIDDLDTFEGELL